MKPIGGPSVEFARNDAAEASKDEKSLRRFAEEPINETDLGATFI
jgi:hypothetical protein